MRAVVRRGARRTWIRRQALAGSNLLLVPQDRRGEWYRYHHLFRDMLLAELRRQEPGLVTVFGVAPPPGAWRTAWPRRRWSTPSPQETLTQSPGLAEQL